MPSERVQRRADILVDRVDDAIDSGDWERASQTAGYVLALDPENRDAGEYLTAAERPPAELEPPSDSGSVAPPSGEDASGVSDVAVQGELHFQNLPWGHRQGR